MTTTSERSAPEVGETGEAGPRRAALDDAESGNPKLSLKNPDRAMRLALGSFALGVALAVAGVVTRVLGADDAGGVLIAVALFFGVMALAFAPAIIYSRRNPERARRTADNQREAQERRLRRHPVAYVVGATVLVGVLLPLRLGLRRSADHEQAWSSTTMVLIGLGAAAVTALIMTLAVRRAQRRRALGDR